MSTGGKAVVKALTAPFDLGKKAIETVSSPFSGGGKTSGTSRPPVTQPSVVPNAGPITTSLGQELTGKTRGGRARSQTLFGGTLGNYATLAKKMLLGE